MIDLTPFGFTPTEGEAYARLVDLGPSSGYALARSVGIARANAYQALDGLVAKGAARIVQENPKIYRAVAPVDLRALVGQRQARLLEDLELALDRLSPTGASSIAEFKGLREFGQLILRAATRDPGVVEFLGPAEAAQAAVPIWRKRVADGLETRLWVYGALPELPVTATGIDEAETARRLGFRPFALAAGEIGVLGLAEATDFRGYWSSDTLVRGAARALIKSAVRP